ncbi:hypothetical protein LAZ67_7002015, partial [Cordylochernes scorpioides]
MLFKGKALEMYALICRDISSLEELHSRMKRFFHEPEHGLHRKFWQVRKGREQSVKEYYFAKIKLATKLGLSQELILEGLTSGIESEFERFLIAASPTSLERWLEIAEAIEISHCRTTSSASGMEMGYPARRRPSTSWQGGQGFRTRNWREGRNDRPGTHLPPTRSQTASLAAVQDHEDSGAVPYVLKSKPVYQPDAKPLPLPDTNDCFLHDNIELFTMVKILLDNHAEIFGENKFNIKPLNIQPPRLRLSDKKPVCVRPYRHSLRDRDLINKQIEQLLKYGLIKPASSPYSAPVTLAPKKGEGRVRLCIDYRLLNRKIISDSFPIPLMEDIVQKVQGARVFSCLDILSAYWTIPLHPKDREMTCFSTSEGSYVWCRLPFGLKTAPAIFNRKLSAILQKYKLDNVTFYFDDILVFSENEESHLKHLGQIFEILRKEGIQLRRDKCLLFMKRITYLGYEISENQISPSGVNVDVIKSLPPPRDLRCLRSFLGSVTHYAKFINNFNNLRAPLNELLKKNSRFIWTEECQRSFEGLKEALCSKPILQLFNPSLATHIYCDASTSGIGAVLKQEYPDGTQKPFTYFSRALRGAESKYTITELELLAVVETCKRYHPYISGSHVIVHTDHKALIWLNSFKHTNGRLFRWSLKLSEYDLDFNYNKGCENHEADMLSRLPYSYFLSAQALKQNQGDLSIPPSKLYSIVDGITYIRLNNKDRVVVPPELQDDLIQKAHESLGHPGISAMIRALSVQYYFKGMIGKIKNYVKNCKECQTIKSSTQPSYGLMGSLPRAAKPFDVVALDTVLGLGGYNSAKNCVHTVIDHHSRYIWGYASKGTSIATYINIINQLLNIGKPRILVTDRHPSFVSKRFNKFLREKGIKHVMTSPSHPECNGLVERANATLIGRLKIQHQGNPRAPWPKLLQKTLEEYRDTPHSTTTFPPIYLLYGTLPSYMSDLTNPYPPVERARTIANEKTEELHKRLVKRYNSSHRFPNLKIGDKVLYRIPHQVGHGKLSPVYYPDPYTVLSTPSPHTVEINKPCQPENKPSTIVNVSKLKLWDPISTSNEGRRNYPFPFQDVEDLNGCISTPISTVSMPSRKIRAHYEHMSEFETGRAIGLKEAGWSNRLIARHLCRSDAVIRRCWQKWVNNGRMQRQDGSGRPRATTEREDRAIVRMAVAAPESTLSTIQRVTATQVSKRTINRRLRERNLRARRPLRCLSLTPVHRQVRLQWCRKRSTWNCADWGRIVFSDESRFLLCPDDRHKRVWRRPGQRVDPGLTVEHHTCSQQGVMVWGAISFDIRTPLVVIPGTLTAQRYVDDIQRPGLLRFLSHHPGLTFQQDNARPHTSRVTMDCLQSCRNLPWSARSPDLSPIEHFWDVMGRRLQPSRNVDYLARQLETIWQEIPKHTIWNLYHRFLNLKYNDKDDLEQYFKEKSALAKKLNLDKTLLLEALTDGMPDHLKKYLIAARVQEPSEWYKITTQLKLSTNKEEEPQQPSTSTSTPVKRFNSNSSKAHQYQPFPRTAAAAHHQQEPHRSINQPPYPCKICASHQLPNQIHFHRDCPLKNNTHPKRINPGRTLLLFSVFINQISLPCVLDTASSISIIPLKYLNHIYYKILDNSPKERIGQVEGFSYPLYKILVRLSLGKITKYQEMFVCDSPIEYLILGLPTFYIFKLQIDFSKNLLFQNYKFLYSFNPKTDNQKSYATTLCIPDPYYVKNSSLLNINPLCNFNSFDIPNTNVKLINPTSNPIIDFNSFHSMRQPDSIINYNSYLDFSKVDINPNFSNQTISDMLHKYKNVFSKHNFDIGHIKTNPICISLLDNIPIAQKPYRTSFYNNAEIQKQITELLKYDIIRPSSSPYSSPALLVNKKSDTPNHPTRLCIDYRKLNQKTVPEHTPIPLIEQIIDRLSQSKIYTILDVKNAYWHIPIDEKDRHKTSFVTQLGCYEWNRLPYGLKNAPSQFERIMKSVFTKHNIHYALNYFDDIIIHSKTYEEHIKHLDDILGTFEQEDIKLNLNKCKFLQKEIQFLGYTINSGKYTPNNTNIEAILKLNRPYNIKTLQRFLGTINIYNKFIPHYAQIRAPLNELLLKNAPWLWSAKHEQAFQTLKNSLISQPVLYIYDPSKPCHLFTDASSLGVAGVLKQPDEQGILHPIGYFSRKLHPYEQNYTASEIETLAIINSVQRFHTYLHNIHFTLHTDHLPLKWIKNVKNPQGRLFRWSLILSQYSFDIKHIKGLNNIEADMLSRAPVSFYLTYNELKEHQSTEQISSAKIKIQNGLYIINRRGFKRAYVPQTLRHKLLNKVHTKHGHIGTTQMTKIISPHFYWSHMSRDIANYTKHCETCQFNKSRDNRIVYGSLQQMPIATHPNHIFSLDTLGGLHNYGTTRHSIHMIVDHHSRFLWAFPTKSVSTDSYITCLRNLFQINKPEIIITDRNAAFLSRKFKHFLDRNNVKHLLTSSHHPETNAKVERLNSTIINRLRCEYNDNLKIPWTKYIPKITESYNETVHTTTGFTPKFLYYGIQPQYIEHDTVTHTPIEKARKLAIERTIKSHEHSKQLYDIKHPEPIFKEGDQVLVKTFIYPNTGKLTQRYIGPFTILKQLSSVTYEIDKPNIPQRKQTEIIHSNKLKLFYPEADFLLHYSTNIENDLIANQNSNTKLIDIDDKPCGERASVLTVWDLMVYQDVASTKGGAVLQFSQIEVLPYKYKEKFMDGVMYFHRILQHW